MLVRGRIWNTESVAIVAAVVSCVPCVIVVATIAIATHPSIIVVLCVTARVKSNGRKAMKTTTIEPIYPGGILPPIPEPPLSGFDTPFREHPYDTARRLDPTTFDGTYPQWNRTAGKKFNEIPNNGET